VAELYDPVSMVDDVSAHGVLPGGYTDKGTSVPCPSLRYFIVTVKIASCLVIFLVLHYFFFSSLKLLR
jgi:hypothetical protein